MKDRWHLSAVLLAISGLLVWAIGTYFLFFRPTLLPEDVRNIGLTPTEFELLAPRLRPWLSNVFHVLGGFASATGLLTIFLAATSFRAGKLEAALIAWLAGGFSIGLMTIVNFAMDSDFKWLLATFALVWVSSLIVFAFDAGSDTRRASKSTSKGKSL